MIFLYIFRSPIHPPRQAWWFSWQEIIKQRDRGSWNRIYNINQHYFDKIDSEDKAYFLGLLYADGCNFYDRKNKKVTISLQEEDKEILKKFSDKLYDGKEFLYFIKGRKTNKNQYGLTLHNKHISTKLNQLGCVAKKSLILKFPEWLIDSELQRHFIRGYFDGDGCISSSQRKNRNCIAYYFSIVSTKDFCNEVLKIIENVLNIHVCKKLNNVKQNITTTIYIKGNLQILKLMDWLYKDANFFINRKYQKYLQLKNMIETKNNIK